MAAIDATSIPVRKLNRTTRAVSIALLFVCAAAVSAHIAYRRRMEPERLNGNGIAALIRNNQLYFTAPIDGDISICTQPVYGRSIRTLVRENAFRLKLLQTDPVSLPNEIAYIVEPPPYSVGASQTLSTGSASRVQDLGEFLTPPSGARTEPRFARHHILHIGDSGLALLHVRAVNTRTGSVRDIVSIPNQGNTVSGNILYWKKYIPGDITVFEDGSKSWREVTGRSELWSTSLLDGSSRRIQTGLTGSAALYPGTDGVMWIQIRAYPDRRVDLCYWRELDKTVHTIADFSTNLWHSRPVEYEGRMYWFDYETPDSGSDGEKWNVDRLMSANLDGSDRRIVSSLIPIRRTAQSWGFDTFSGATIKIYHGSMYCIFQPTTAKLSSQYEGAYLCRIHPERAEPVDILYALPNGASQIRFDEGYLYFALAESTRSAWARLTSDAANVESAYTLCRVKVPN